MGWRSGMARPWRSGAWAPSGGRAGAASEAKFHWAASQDLDRVRHDPEDVFLSGMRHHHIANTAYPIGHLTTLKPYRVRRVRDQHEILETLQGAYPTDLEDMMLYAHVPFCHQRCQFCEYTVVDPRRGGRDEEIHRRYFSALEGELELYAKALGLAGRNVVGFDVGGGTPSFVDAEHIVRLVGRVGDMVHLPSDVEISIETTPKIAAAEPEKIKAYYDAGIRRISMGLQTTDFRMAKELGRDDEGYVERAVQNIRDAGFESFNVDLMYGFPIRQRGGAQGAASVADKWEETVRSTMAVEPDHITLYRMRYKGTRMAHLQDRVPLHQVNRQGELAAQLLEENGYAGWVGKNTYSRTPNNSGCSDYLHRRVVEGVPYVGLGLGAQSFSHHTLTYNLGGVTKKLNQYVTSVALGRLPTQDVYHLSRPAAMGKMASVSFYFGGIDDGHFRSIFGVGVQDVFPLEVAFALDAGLMQWEFEATDGSLVPEAMVPSSTKTVQWDRRRLQLTKEGKRHFAGVVALFYSPGVQAHVMRLPGGEAEVAAEARDRLAELRQDEKGRAMVGVEVKDAGGTEVVEVEREVLPEEKSKARMFDFGNILFGGPCNQRCNFCIGKHLPPKMTATTLRTRPADLRGLPEFIKQMQDSGTNKVIFTGTSTDPQLYKYEAELQGLLRKALGSECHLSLHTNGLLALRKLTTFNDYDSCTISLNSLDPEKFHLMHGVRTMPDLAALLRAAKIPLKLSCVVNDNNWDEVVGSDGTFLPRCRDLGIRRVALRKVHDPKRYQDTAAQDGAGMEGATRTRPLHPNAPTLASERGNQPRRLQDGEALAGREPARYFRGNPVFDIEGLECTVWDFDHTESRSLNLFPDGTISDQYLLVDAPLGELQC